MSRLTLVHLLAARFTVRQPLCNRLQCATTHCMTKLAWPVKHCDRAATRKICSPVLCACVCLSKSTAFGFRSMLLLGLSGFSWESPISPSLASHCCSILTSFHPHWCQDPNESKFLLCDVACATTGLSCRLLMLPAMAWLVFVQFSSHRAYSKQAIAGNIHNLQDNPVAAHAASQNKNLDSCYSTRVVRALQSSSKNSELTTLGMNSSIYNKIQAAVWSQHQLITASNHAHQLYWQISNFPTAPKFATRPLDATGRMLPTHDALYEPGLVGAPVRGADAHTLLLICIPCAIRVLQCHTLPA
ncbi:hypothetical protein PR048_025921 [Dryococelus australis]|uniref:Uncharacterized protein n=1 Tax=Dryococelus australis TaxID=614101 RepID=A0ABQ9GJX2_9NEOP|nr:hypothetical protein PR048_025921 [Dryococelus australis]